MIMNSRFNNIYTNTERPAVFFSLKILYTHSLKYNTKVHRPHSRTTRSRLEKRARHAHIKINLVLLFIDMKLMRKTLYEHITAY